MNPDTKEFVDLAPPILDQLTDDTRRQVEGEIEEATQEWPKFKAGMKFELQGVTFRIWKITSRGICAQPVDDVELKPSRARRRG